jgi:hypothetical protein
MGGTENNKTKQKQKINRTANKAKTLSFSVRSVALSTHTEPALDHK